MVGAYNEPFTIRNHQLYAPFKKSFPGVWNLFVVSANNWYIVNN